MNKARILSAILTLLMLCSVCGFQTFSANAEPITPRDKLSMALEIATFEIVADGGT